MGVRSYYWVYISRNLCLSRAFESLRDTTSRASDSRTRLHATIQNGSMSIDFSDGWTTGTFEQTVNWTKVNWSKSHFNISQLSIDNWHKWSIYQIVHSTNYKLNKYQLHQGPIKQKPIDLAVSWTYDQLISTVACIPLCRDVMYGNEPSGNAVARVPIRGYVRYGYEPGGNVAAHIPLTVSSYLT